MKKIDKLILKELIPTVLLALVVLTVVLFSRDFQKVARLFLASGTSPGTFLKVLGSILPNVLFITLPMAVLVGVVSSFSRMSSDSEITALRACGIGVLRLYRPVFFLSLIFFAITLCFTTYLTPRGNAHLRDLQYEIALGQVQGEIQPRTFYDKLRNYVFFVEEVIPSQSLWKGIFIADSSKPGEQKIYLARTGTLRFSGEDRALLLHLEDGLHYRATPQHPEVDSVARFQSVDVPMGSLVQEDPEKIPKRNMEKTMEELSAEMSSGKLSSDSDKLTTVCLEYYSRLALPFACLVLPALGVPLGIQRKRGGRSYGFMVAIGLIILYYLVFVYGWKFGENTGLYPIRYGVWIANVLFAIAGAVALLFSNAERHPMEPFFRSRPGRWLLAKWEGFRSGAIGLLPFRTRKTPQGFAAERPFRLLGVVDSFLVREYGKILALTVGSALSLFIIFTLFELVDEIHKHNIPWSMVGDYFISLTPYVLVLILPLCILVSLLVTIAVLDRTNQITALKAGGISVFRISLPLIVVVVAISAGVFLLQELVLPYSNQRQDSIRAHIMGRRIANPNQSQATWIMGHEGILYYYDFYDATKETFAGLSAFQLDISRAELRQRWFSSRASWDRFNDKWIMVGGWSRRFGTQEEFRPFGAAAHFWGDRPDYFRTEGKRADKMSFQELSSYIGKLRSSGFDTLSLEVDLHKKLAYPIVNLVMLLIGLPFAFLSGKRGALFGVAASILIGVTFWILFNVFSAMGAYGILPPFLAAWAPNLFFASAGVYLFLKLRS